MQDELTTVFNHLLMSDLISLPEYGVVEFNTLERLTTSHPTSQEEEEDKVDSRWYAKAAPFVDMVNKINAHVTSQALYRWYFIWFI